MTTFKQALRAALGDALDLPSGAVRRTAARGGSIARVSGGELVELLSEPLTRCPHCNKPLQRPATRRRRLVQVMAGGRVLATEIDP